MSSKPSSSAYSMWSSVSGRAIKLYPCRRSRGANQRQEARYVATTRVIVKDGIAGERAVERLKRLIFTGDLAPGEQLRQEDMARRPAVSRPLVREALRALAMQELIEHRPHQGFFVAKRAPIELAQIMLMLDLLEPELMRSMTQPLPVVLGRREELNRRMEELIDEWDNFETLTLNREFHFLLFDESPYRLVLQEVERPWVLAEPFISQKLSSPRSRLLAVEEHRHIIAALSAGDLATAADAHDTHRASGRQGVLPLLTPPSQTTT
jgi:DNA-binding GntR family transcriptional regulator